MKAFLTALLAVAVIAATVHFTFQWLAPQWNSATMRSGPTVRLAPEDLPSPAW